MKNNIKNKKRPSKDRQKPNHKRAKSAPDQRAQGKTKTKLTVHLFGFHAVEAAWANPQRHIHSLYLTENAARQFESVLKENKSLKRPDPIIVDKTDLDKALPPGTVHQGIGLNCQALPEQSVQDLIIEAANNPASLFVILDQVTDPHNVGAILRSACAFGANGLIQQSRHAPEAAGILAKTASGALEHVPIANETNLSRTIETLQKEGYFVYGLDERGKDLKTLGNLPDRVAIVLGAEGPGLRPLIKSHCDELVKLPTTGPISSLNVSNAAAVTLCHFVK